MLKVLDEMLYVRSERASDNMAEWVEVDSDNLAREGTHVKERVVAKDENFSDDSPIKQDSDEADL